MLLALVGFCLRLSALVGFGRRCRLWTALPALSALSPLVGVVDAVGVCRLWSAFVSVVVLVGIVGVCRLWSALSALISVVGFAQRWSALVGVCRHWSALVGIVGVDWHCRLWSALSDFAGVSREGGGGGTTPL